MAAVVGKSSTDPHKKAMRRLQSARTTTLSRICEPRRRPSSIGQGIDIGPGCHEVVDLVEEVGLEAERRRGQQLLELLSGPRADDGCGHGGVLDGEGKREVYEGDA